MAPVTGEPAGVQLASWRQYTGARLERYLQNLPLSGSPFYTYALCLKIESQYFFYDIYDFAINRIYKRNLQYVYLGFSEGFKVVEKLFFVGENKSRCEW